MRVSRTPVALAALLFVTACSGSAEPLAPAGTSASTATTEERGGLGMSGSGNSVDGVSDDGIGQIGSGNVVQSDTAGTSRGLGWIGSGN